jgi:hypothetical protein
MALVAWGMRLADNSLTDSELVAVNPMALRPTLAGKSAPGNPKGLGCEDFADKSLPAG